MTNQPVLRARTQPATAPVPASEADAQLSVALREAQAIAKAGDMIPKSYRGNPGAVLLIMDWARGRGVALHDAMQSVVFVQGKAVIEATMQRALAKAAGYRVDFPKDMQTDSSATARVLEVATGEVIGEVTYTLEDAKRAGLAGKDNWKKNPGDMLVARATTRAVRRFVPEIMVGAIGGQDEFDEIRDREDPIAVLQDAGGDQDPQTVDVAHDPVGESEEPSGTPSDVPPESSPATDDAEDAEIVGDGEITPSTLMAVTEAMSAAKRRDNWAETAQAMQAEGLEMVAKRMTEAEGKRALEMLK